MRTTEPPPPFLACQSPGQAPLRAEREEGKSEAGRSQPAAPRTAPVPGAAVHLARTWPPPLGASWDLHLARVVGHAPGHPLGLPISEFRTCGGRRSPGGILGGRGPCLPA